jgi:hypothetical protein
MNASKLNVGATPIVSGTVGRVLFQGTGNVLQQSANLFWDDANLRLGINGTPTSSLEIFYNPTGISNTIGLTLNSGSTGSTLKAIRFTAGTFGELGTFGVNTGSGEFRWATSASYFPTIYSNGAERLRIATTGNVLINTTTDAGFRLDVNGTARVKGVGTTSSTTAFTVQNSSGTTNFLIRDDGQLSSSGTDSNIYSNFTTGNKSPLLFSHSGYGTATPNDTRIDIGFRGRQPGGLNSYDFLTYKVFQGTDPNVTTGFEFYTHQNQSGASASVLAMSINGGNVGIGTTSPSHKLTIAQDGYNLRLANTAAANGYNIGRNNANGLLYFYGDQSGFNGYVFDGINGERMRIAGSTGNVLINTTTDAGFRLDVNGTARFQGETQIGLGTTGVINNLIFNSNRGGAGLRAGIYWSSGSSIINRRKFSGGNDNTLSFLVGTTTELLTIQEHNGTVVTNNVGINNTNPNPSAVLDVASTTQGFLPPRMTNAQRTAIVSPAVGLIVYCTDVTEGLWIYKSLGWTFIV